MPEYSSVPPPEAVTTSGSLAQRLRGLLMFVDLPIKKKFLLFAGSTLLWFCLMTFVTVVSMSALHYRYHQVAEQIVPYRQVIETVLIRLQYIDQHLSLGNGDGMAAHTVIRRQLEAIRMSINELSLRQKRPPAEGTIVERILQNMAEADPEGVRYLQEILAQLETIDRSLEHHPRMTGKSRHTATADGSYAAAQGAIADTIALSKRHLEQISAKYTTIDQYIYKNIRNSIHTTLGLLLFASLLLALFTHWIIVAFYKPIKTITNQIESLSTGDIDLAKKVTIPSRDEIGTLSRKFNSLMESVYSMTIYKKVIEEDSSLEEVYRRLGEVFSNDLGLREYCIYEVNTPQKEMKAAYPPLVGDIRLHCQEDILSDCTLCRAVKTGHNISSFEFSGICRFFAPEEGVGHVCIPMMLGGNTGGVVQFRFPATGQSAPLSAEDTTRLFKAETYINQSLSVIEAKRLMQTLQESALVDPLTGLYNRRFLQEHTKQIIAGVLRRNKQIGLLVCDLDYFKQVNDTHGHDTGDQMLRETANILKSSVREADLVIRFGGEEFLVVLLDSEPGMAMQVAEKIRVRVEQFKLRVGDTILQKSISIGVSEFPGDSDGFWQAIKFADVALYRAKETGRNRVVRFTPEMWQHGDF